MATVKYNSAGAQQWIRKYDGPGHGNDNGAAIGVDGSGNVYVAGTSLGSTSDLDFVTLKYNSLGQVTTAHIVPEELNTNGAINNIIAIYPNPAHNFFKLQLPGGNTYDITITDVTGEKVFEERNMKAQSQINCEKFSSGTYFVNARNNEKTFTEKFVKQ